MLPESHPGEKGTGGLLGPSAQGVMQTAGLWDEGLMLSDLEEWDGCD